MADEYRNLVKKAWKALKTSRYDSRGFVQVVEDLVAERNKLLERINVLETNVCRFRTSFWDGEYEFECTLHYHDDGKHYDGCVFYNEESEETIWV